MKILHYSLMLLVLALTACAPNIYSDDDNMNDNISYDAWRHSLKTPENPDMKASGNTIITKETTVQQIDPSVVRVAHSKGDYMEVMARRFRQDLLTTGAQVQHRATMVRVMIPTQSVFGTNLVAIKPAFEPVLKSIAENLRQHDETMIKIVGHVDGTGSVLRDKELSLRQAKALVNFLTAQKVNEKRLLAEGKGSSEPQAMGNTAKGRAQNSFMEMLIYNLQ